MNEVSSTARASTVPAGPNATVDVFGGGAGNTFQAAPRALSTRRDLEAPGGGRQDEQPRRPISAKGQRLIGASEAEHFGDLPPHAGAACPGSHEARAARSGYGEKGPEPARRPLQTEDVDGSALERRLAARVRRAAIGPDPAS